MRISKLQVTINEENFSLYLGTSSLNHEILFQKRKDYLNASELEIFENLKFKKKRKSFLQSRHLSKNILSRYLLETDLTKLIINHGVFTQPIVNYVTNLMPTISISHTNTHTACIASSSKYPTAIDIETISADSKKNILSQTTNHERKNIKHEEDENTFYTRIWTIKEALSKVLKTGITTPFSIYEINNIIYTKNYTIGRFSNFSQYLAISYHFEKHILSFVIPSSTNSQDIDKISSILSEMI